MVSRMPRRTNGIAAVGMDSCRDSFRAADQGETCAVTGAIDPDRTPSYLVGSWPSRPQHSVCGGGGFSDGPIGMFLLSPFARGIGKTAYSNRIPYDHRSTLKTLPEILQVGPLLGAAADPQTNDLSDLF